MLIGNSNYIKIDYAYQGHNLFFFEKSLNKSY